MGFIRENILTLTNYDATLLGVALEKLKINPKILLLEKNEKITLKC